MLLAYFSLFSLVVFINSISTVASLDNSFSVAKFVRVSGWIGLASGSLYIFSLFNLLSSVWVKGDVNAVYLQYFLLIMLVLSTFSSIVFLCFLGFKGELYFKI